MFKLKTVIFVSHATREPTVHTTPPPTTMEPAFFRFKINCSASHTFCKTNSGLQEVPTEIIPHETAQINLSNNSIENLNNDSFTGFTNVIHIDLKHNSLSSIPHCVFHDQKKLQYLDVAYNNIKFINESLFKCLYTLQFLKITGNLVVDSNFDAFFPLGNLSTLNVDINMLVIFYPIILNGQNYPQTITHPKVVADEANSLPCNSSSCWLMKAEEKGYMDHYTFNGRPSTPRCSNIPGLFWDEAELGCSSKGRSEFL